MQTSVLLSAATTLALCLSGAAQAKTLTYEAILNDLSGLGGSGKASLILDNVADTLFVHILATGFAPGMLHVAHIHGTFDGNGNPTDATTLTLANDTDGDGVVELLEGLPSYGGILLSLFDEGKTGNGFSGFSSAPGGIIDLSYTCDLKTTTALNSGVSAKDLFPLDFREIVIHGAYLNAGIGGVGNETGMIPAGYSNFVPVAAGEIRMTTPTPVPLPAAFGFLVAGLGGLGALRFGRRGAV